MNVEDCLKKLDALYTVEDAFPAFFTMKMLLRLYLFFVYLDRGFVPMRLSKVKFNNYRGFENKEFSLDKSVVLFVGDNARGKTSVLKGISLALSSWMSVFPQIDSLKYSLEDVRKVASRENSEIPTFNPCSESYVQGTMVGIKGKFFVEWKRQYGSHSRSDELKKLAKKYLLAAEKENFEQLPYFGYYGTGRLWDVDKRLTNRKKKAAGRNSRYMAYRDALESSSTEKLLRNWIERLSHAEYIAQKKSPVLESIWDCLKKIVPGVVNVNWNPKIDDIVFSFEDGKTLPLYNLSEGQRIVVSLVSDLCVRMSLLNPNLNERARLETDGVVLIDEVDLHLHPKWQKSLIPNLVELFPKIQFILTTHSPFIIQSMEGIRNSGIINLDDPDSSYDFTRLSSRSVEDIAEYVMNVVLPQRSENFIAMEKAAEKYYAMLSSKKSKDEIESAERELKRLSVLYEDNPAYAAYLKVASEIIEAKNA